MVITKRSSNHFKSEQIILWQIGAGNTIQCKEDLSKTQVTVISVFVWWSCTAKPFASHWINLWHIWKKKALLSNWKKVNVVPICKTESRCIFRKYRPVLLFRIFAQIFELYIYDEIYPHLINKNLTPISNWVFLNFA